MGQSKHFWLIKTLLRTARLPQATRNGLRVGELCDSEAFANKLQILSKDGAKRFGPKWQYDVDADIEAYVEIAKKVEHHSADLSRTQSHLPALKSMLISGKEFRLVPFRLITFCRSSHSSVILWNF